MGAPCQTCGGNGWSELLATCSKCCIAHEHCYCMREHSFEVPRDWVCIGCLMKPVRNDLDSDSSNVGPSGHRNSPRRVKARSESSKPVPKWKAIPERAKVKLISPEEVIRLSSGVTKKGFPSSNAGPRSLSADSAVGYTRQTVAGLEAKGSKSATGTLKLNLSSLQTKTVESPRQGALQIVARDTKQVAKAPKGLEGKRVTFPCLGESSGGHEQVGATGSVKELGNSYDDTKNANDSRGRNAEVGARATDHDAETRCPSSLSHKLVQCLPFLPALHPTWKGGFLDSATLGEFYGEFQAKPPSTVHQKAYKLSKTMPEVLKVELLPVGEDLLKNGKPDLSDIALYFFPDEKIERSKERYARLFETMVIRNAMIRSNVGGAELLIFTSKLLDETVQSIIEMQKNTRNFLWGVFRRIKKLPPLDLQQDSHNDAMDVNGQDVVDMDIDTEGDNFVSSKLSTAFPSTFARPPKKIREDNVPSGHETIPTSESRYSFSTAAVSERIIRECPATTGSKNPGVWSRPPNNWVKLNIQGISKPGSDLAGAGGIVRDESGQWICAYILNLNSMPALPAEFWGLFQGLKLLWERGFRKVLVETTNPTAVDALKTGSSKPSSTNTIMQRCRDMIQRDWECRVSFISTEENACAIWLASRLEYHPAGFVLFDDPPRGLITLLETDRVVSASSISPSYHLSQ